MNKLDLISGETYKVDDILVKHPTVGEIVELTEEKYLNLLSPFISVPIDLSVQLDDIGIDYSELNNYDIFLILSNSDDNSSGLEWLLGEGDFRVELDTKTNKDVLTNGNIIIDEDKYSKIAEFILKINNRKQDDRKPGNKETRKYLIEKKRREMKRNSKKPQKNNESYIASSIENLVWGTNYGVTFETIKKLPIYNLYRGLEKIQKIVEYKLTMTGVYNGTLDPKQTSLEKLHWLN